MKLSEFKKKIIKVHGKEIWEKLEEMWEYKTYTSSKEKQIEKIKANGINIQYVGIPTDELIEMAIENIDNTYDLTYLLCLIENDLDKIIKISELRNMTLEEIKELLNN